MEYNSCIDERFKKQCSMLREVVSCDFTGIALQKHSGMDIIWPYVSGNTNEKYKYITVRFGKGVAGKIISSSSPMLIEQFPENTLGKSTDYPILLAEKLISVYAVPIVLNGIPKGVILIGYRTLHVFTKNERMIVEKVALSIQQYPPNYLV
ncbi:GAF domain-containing protein [Aquibacillus salsiterrae]|uniref:GAF domain-containing protein n=1 Tax=Aquibacillus salsiterrae TaxID=2950439 RepID=A0A9X3WI81_9BACI|nr:GAF domain-containing protein [Aquibacillus salsiterrae]MDC3417859.1 GAF domain-containing protein [Aquibacillus salsiterrae]